MDSWKDCIILASNEHDFVLSTSTTNPIKAYVHRFGSVLHNCVSDDTIDGNFAKLNWCWTLDVAHFMSGIANRHIIYAVDKT